MKASNLIFELETELLKNIIFLVTKGGTENIAAAEWKLKKLNELGRLKKETAEILKKDIKKVLVLSKEEIFEKGNEAKNIIDAGLSESLPKEASERLKTVWGKYETLNAEQISKMAPTLLSKTEAIYLDIIEGSVAKVLSGANTLRESIKETCNKWINIGIELKDKSGKNWSPESYSQMVIRSNIRQVTTETQVERMDELNLDLVEISSHIGAREGCEPYQGKIFSLSGKSDKYPPLSSTSYGEIAGLFGINCGHRMYPYIEGIKKTYSPYPKKENDKAYAESQQQRLFERGIRKEKRELLKVDLSEKEKLKHKANIAKFEDKINNLGRTRREDREQIYTGV